MVQRTEVSTEKRYAVVTGANRGIGFEICRQLASHGITVVLAARDEKRGLEALQKLKNSADLSDDLLFFHQLDVEDASSVASLAKFVENKFGRLDILVNNAGIGGCTFKPEFLKACAALEPWTGKPVDWSATLTTQEESVVKCLNTNYYGVKTIVEAFTPLLNLSSSPRIVSVSSWWGTFKFMPNEWAKGILSDVENLTEERVEEVAREYLKLKDFTADYRQANGWPLVYHFSKACLNAYTRILAKKFPNWKVNAVCPGCVQTESTYNWGITVEEGAGFPVEVALMPHDECPSGLFLNQGKVASF